MGDGRKLFVAKLPKDIEEDEMDQIFSTYGTVEEVVLMDPSRSNKPDERTGFVIYKTVEAAGVAVEVLNGVYRFREESVEAIHVSFARGKAGKGKDSKGDRGDKGDGRGDRKGDRKGDGKGKDKSDKSYNESYSHSYNDRNDRQFHDRDSHRRSFGGGRGHEAPASSPGYSASRPVYRGDGGSQIRERSRGRDAGYASYAPRREEFRGSDFGRERERERDERDRYPPREQSRIDRYRGEQREREYESRNSHDFYDRREGNFREDRYRSDRPDRPDRTDRPERGRPDRQERSDRDRRPERFDDRGHGYGGSHGGHGGHDRGHRNEAYRPPPGDDRSFKEDRRGGGAGGAGSKVYVGNLPSDVTKEVLQRVFSTYGPVEDIHIMTGRSKSGQASAFVKYFGAGEALDAISAMKQGYEVRPGQGLLQVRLADGEAPKGGGRGGDRSRPY